MDENTNGSWETWFQNVGAKVIGGAADAAYSQPYEIQKLRLQQMGQLGYYKEGQAGFVRPNAGMAGGSTLLLIGGAVLLFMLMRD